nr:MAG TPA: hypothetical protein [Crassvirales sp.]
MVLFFLIKGMGGKSKSQKQRDKSERKIEARS